MACEDTKKKKILAHPCIDTKFTHTHTHTHTVHNKLLPKWPLLQKLALFYRGGHKTLD